MVGRTPHNVHEQLLAGRELDPEFRRLAEAHATGCAACRAMLAAEGLLQSHWTENAGAVSAAFVRDTCEKAFSSTRSRAPLWWVSLPPSWRIGIAALLVVAVLGGFQFGRPPEPPACEEPTVVSVLDSPELVAMKAKGAPASPGE